MKDNFGDSDASGSALKGVATSHIFVRTLFTVWRILSSPYVRSLQRGTPKRNLHIPKNRSLVEPSLIRAEVSFLLTATTEVWITWSAESKEIDILRGMLNRDASWGVEDGGEGRRCSPRPASSHTRNPDVHVCGSLAQENRLLQVLMSVGNDPLSNPGFGFGLTQKISDRRAASQPLIDTPGIADIGGSGRVCASIQSALENPNTIKLNFGFQILGGRLRAQDVHAQFGVSSIKGDFEYYF